MLTDSDVELFLDGLPQNARQLIGIASNKERWPQDEVLEIKQAIEQLSELISKVSAEAIAKADLSAALSSMALMKLPRAMLLLDVILSYKPEFLAQIIEQPGQAGREVQHKLIMINRLMFLARSRINEQVFSADKCALISKQLKRVSQ